MDERSHRKRLRTSERRVEEIPVWQLAQAILRQAIIVSPFKLCGRRLGSGRAESTLEAAAVSVRRLLGLQRGLPLPLRLLLSLHGKLLQGGSKQHKSSTAMRNSRASAKSMQTAATVSIAGCLLNGQSSMPLRLNLTL